MAAALQLPTHSFPTGKAWNTWLKEHHNDSQGIWLRIFKKVTGKPTVTYAEALDEALCFGWIDSQKKGYDAESWLQKFSPRRPRSIWSKTNTQHIERLKKEGKMEKAGLAAVDAAKQDGRWDRAYHSQKTAVVPKDFLKLLSKQKNAYMFFKTLNKANLYSIIFRLQQAKTPQARARRMENIIAMLANGEKFHE